MNKRGLTIVAAVVIVELSVSAAVAYHTGDVQAFVAMNYIWAFGNILYMLAGMLFFW